MLRVNVVTLFPEMVEAPLKTSILGRAAAAGLFETRLVHLRDYTHDRHRTVDDAPYGGGAGMVLKPEPFFEALDDLANASLFTIGTPVRITMRFSTTTRADILQAIPGMRRVDGFTVAYTARDMVEAYPLIRLMYKYVSF